MVVVVLVVVVLVMRVIRHLPIEVNASASAVRHEAESRHVAGGGRGGGGGGSRGGRDGGGRGHDRTSPWSCALLGLSRMLVRSLFGGPEASPSTSRQAVGLMLMVVAVLAMAVGIAHAALRVIPTACVCAFGHRALPSDPRPGILG